MARPTWWLTLGMVAACAGGALAQPSWKREPEREHVHARLASEREALVAGETGYVGIVYEIEPGWHTYWPGLNDTGFPITAKIEGPAGYAVGPVIYPAPERHVAPGEILDHVYEGTLLLMVPIEVPADAAGSRVTLTGSGDWLVCNEACIPGAVKGLELTMPVVSAGEEAAPSKDAELFARTRAAVPKPIETSEGAVRLRWTAGTVLVETNDAIRIEFYPGVESVPLADPIGGAVSDDRRLILRPAKGEDGAIEGVLRVDRPGRNEPAYYTFSVDPHPPVAEPGSPGSATKG